MYEDIKSLKELLDSGVISQWEYDKKKSEILGIETAEDKELRKEIETAQTERAEREAELRAKRTVGTKVEAKRWGKAVGIVASVLVAALVAASLDSFIAKSDEEKAAKQAQVFIEDMTPYLAFLGEHAPNLNISMSQELIDDSYSIRFGSTEGTVSHMTTDTSRQILDLCTWKSNAEVSNERFSEMIACLSAFYNSEGIEQQVSIEEVGEVDAIIWRDVNNVSAVCIWQADGEVGIRWAHGGN